jgi:hypothetical protein
MMDLYLLLSVIMISYQLFYQVTVKLLALKPSLKFDQVIGKFENFSDWFKLESFADIEHVELKALYSNIADFFRHTCPNLRSFND